MTMTEQIKKPNNQIKNASVANLFTLYWNNKSAFLVSDISRLFSSAVASLLPYFLARIATTSDDNDLLFMLLLFLFVNQIVHGIFWAFSDVMFATRINRKFYEFREVMFETVWRRKYKEFISLPSGKTAATITRVHTYLSNLYGSISWDVLPLVGSVPVFIILMFNVIIENVFMYVIFLVVVAIVLKFQLNLIKRTQSKFADADTTADGNIFDSVSNFVNVISFGGRTKELLHFRDYNKHLEDSSVKAMSTMMWFWAGASAMLRIVLWGVIFFFNFYLYDNGSISFEQFVLSITVLIDFSSNFWRMVEAFGSGTQHFANYKENYDYLFAGRNIYKEHLENPYQDIKDVYPSEHIKPPKFENDLVIKNLSFSYPDQPDVKVLDNISLQINKGEKIGVVGKSGSGKTSLVKLLLGFYQFENGSIKVDGADVTSAEIAKLNCYVPQDTTLFQQTIAYNIAYARNDEVALDEVIQAAKKAHAHEFIVQLKQGYDTLVGERGIKLSLGQRQRIAIARAFLKESQLLILDEATSALDSKTESLVQESLEKLWDKNTVIAVAHRLSTLNNVDRIIVMDKGKIVEQGTKKELLALDGYFAELWQHQRDGMILDDDDEEVYDD